MEQNKLEFKVSNEVGELIIREGQALPLKERRPINYTGTITAPFNYLDKNKDTANNVETLVWINMDTLSIGVEINVHNHYVDVIIGKLQLSEELKAFNINETIERDTLDLATLFKMNRHWFKSTQEGMKFVSDLSSFEARVNKEIQNHQDQKGNQRHLKSQAVDSNIPEKITLNIPIFKGQPRVDIDVEVVVNPTNLNCALISPDLKMVIETQTAEIIMGQVEKIKAIIPLSPILYG